MSSVTYTLVTVDRPQLPQCVQCLIDCEGLSQSHSSFRPNPIPSKTAVGGTHTYGSTDWYNHETGSHDRVRNDSTPMINRADRSRPSQLPQCLQCLVDYKDFPQSHSSFTSSLIDQNIVYQKHNHTVMYLLQWSTFGCHEKLRM